MVNLVVRHSNTTTTGNTGGSPHGHGHGHGQNPQQVQRSTPVNNKKTIPPIVTSSSPSPRGEASKSKSNNTFASSSIFTADINTSSIMKYEQPVSSNFSSNSPSAYRSPVGGSGKDGRGEDASSIPSKNTTTMMTTTTTTTASANASQLPRSSRSSSPTKTRPLSSRSRREMSLFLSSTSYGRNMMNTTGTTTTTTTESQQQQQQQEEDEEIKEPRNDSSGSDDIHNNDVEERQQPPTPTSSSLSLSSKQLASGSVEISTTRRTTTEELVCDYDQSVTPLYEMLESSRWDDALLRCQTHPVECHTWIVRRVDVSSNSNSRKKKDEQHQNGETTITNTSNDNIRWKLLPLHAAVIFQSPASLIEKLIQENPSAASKRDDQGMLPLHLAFRHKLDETVVGKLITEHPQGVLCQDNRGRLPIDLGKESRYYSKYLLKLLMCEMNKVMSHHGRIHEHNECCSNNSRDCSIGDRSNDNKKTSSRISISRSLNSDRDKVQTTSSGQDGQNTVDHQVQEVTTMYETKMKELEEIHQAQVLALTAEHERMKSELQIEMESRTQQTSKQHAKEMDEIRSMLAREVASRQKSDQLQSDMEQLKISLGDYQQECKVLRRVVHDQKIQYDNLLEDMVQVTNDQKVIHEMFEEQQEELNHSKHERELLLKKLLQLDEGTKDTTTRSTAELSQVLHRIFTRTKQVRNKYERGLKTWTTPELVQKGVLGLVDATEKPSIVASTTEDLVMTHRSNYNPPTPLMGDERRLICADEYEQQKGEADPSPATATWDNNCNHLEDDVSAITENTNF